MKTIDAFRDFFAALGKLIDAPSGFFDALENLIDALPRFFDALGKLIDAHQPDASIQEQTHYFKKRNQFTLINAPLY